MHLHHQVVSANPILFGVQQVTDGPVDASILVQVPSPLYSFFGDIEGRDMQYTFTKESRILAYPGADD